MHKRLEYIAAKITSITNNPWKVTRFIAGHWRSLFSDIDKTRSVNIVMFHVGRCGSSVLGDLLDQHPQIYWDGEIYERLIQSKEASIGKTLFSKHGIAENPIRYLARRMKRAGKKAYGFEVKFFHLKYFNISMADYIGELKKNGYNHFIILERKNYLKTITSAIIAHETGKYHKGKTNKAEISRVKLDVENIKIDRGSRPLIEYLQDYRRSFEELRSLLGHSNVIELTYENDIYDDPQIGYRRVCDSLAIGSFKKTVLRFGKTNPFKLEELIVNYDEVETCLIDTEFEWMLYE